MAEINDKSGDLQGGVICRRCNAKAVNLAGGEVRCVEIGAVISSAETSEAVKCSAPCPPTKLLVQLQNKPQILDSRPQLFYGPFPRSMRI